MAAKKRHFANFCHFNASFHPLEILTQSVNRCNHEFVRNRIANFSDQKSFIPKPHFRFFSGTLPVLTLESWPSGLQRLNIASYNQRKDDIFSASDFFVRLIFFEIYACKVIGNFANFAKFRYVLAVITASAREILTSHLAGLLVTWRRCTNSNFGWPWPTFVTLTHI